MKATAIVDVLSHWCVAAWPAFEALSKKVGPSNVELLIAPVHNGFPPGYTPETLAWYFKRGTGAYGTELRSDWYENDTTTTLWAKVVAVARIAGMDAGRLNAQIDRAETGAALNAGNAALARWAYAERPSWRIENANGDFILMQGIWNAAPLVACVDALIADEKAYAAAGGLPA